MNGWREYRYATLLDKTRELLAKLDAGNHFICPMVNDKTKEMRGTPSAVLALFINIEKALRGIEMKHDAVKTTREEFEERMFNRRFLGSITRNPDPPKLPVGCFDLVSKDCPTMAEFIAKKDDVPCDHSLRGSPNVCSRGTVSCSGDHDDYKDDLLNALWWAWGESEKRLEGVLMRLLQAEDTPTVKVRLSELFETPKNPRI